MYRERELWERLEKLEARVAELEARPQPTYPFGGAGGNYFPWGTMTTGTQIVPSSNGTQCRVTVVGDNVSRETPKGPNGAGGPK